MVQDKAALLEYFSSLGLSHIAIFIATLLGVFQILGILKNQVKRKNKKTIIFVSVVYVAIVCVGIYSLFRYSYYLRVSTAIVWDLGISELVKPEENPIWSYEAWPYHDKEILWIERAVFTFMKGCKGSWIILLAFFGYVVITIGLLIITLGPCPRKFIHWIRARAVCPRKGGKSGINPEDMNT